MPPRGTALVAPSRGVGEGHTAGHGGRGWCTADCVWNASGVSRSSNPTDLRKCVGGERPPESGTPTANSHTVIARIECQGLLVCSLHE